jgi:hypothetical protein
MHTAAAIRNIVLVTVLTVLVWAFAESESLHTKSIRFDVLVDADPAGGRVARVLDGQAWPGRVQLSVEGATSAIDALEPLTRRALRLAPGIQSFPAVAGENIIDLRAAIRELPEFRGSGVTIQACDPPTLRVVVDEIITSTIPVRVSAGDSQFESQPVVRPASVTLSVSKRVGESLGADLAATATIDPQTLARLVPGRTENIASVPLTLPIDLPPDTYIRFSPPSVDVGVTLRSRTGSIVLPSVPVHIRLAAAELSRWKIDIPESDRFLTDVRVSGPDELIDQVRREEIKITAVVALSFEELERGITSKEATFAELPSPLKFEAAKRLVRLSITKLPPVPVEPAR